jgi:hypothetical protein
MLLLLLLLLLLLCIMARAMGGHGPGMMQITFLI